jgi:adenosylmethionine-8-amino-7-oxononanoate aminotransferase
VNVGDRDRRHYLALGDAYHGDSIGSLSVGAGGFGTDLFDPLRFEAVVRTPGYRDPEWAKRAMEALDAHADRLAALVLEPLMQGAEGMWTASPEDVTAVVRRAQDAGVLVICDEVATGFGRTGALFASERCAVRPDLLCLGKGITGGYLPMSATVASGRVADGFRGEDLGPKTLYHGHSYGGNALAAAVALRHLELLEQWSVLDNVGQRSAQLRAGLARHVAPLPQVARIRQHGLMVGVELAPPPDQHRWGRRVCAESVERGVLLRPLGDVIAIVPILTSTAAEIDRIVEVLSQAIEAGCQ